MKLEKAVAKLVRRALHRINLFDGLILLTSPSMDLRQVNGQCHAANGVLGNGQEFTSATSLSKCIFFPLEPGVDHTQKADSSREVGLLCQKLFYVVPGGHKGRSRF